MTDRYMSDHKDRMREEEKYDAPCGCCMTPETYEKHSEVEGLVETAVKKAVDDMWVWVNDNQASNQDFEVGYMEMFERHLRTAITTHSAKERERAALIVEELMEDNEYWQPIASRILGRTVIKKADITPQTDVTKN